MNILVIGGTRLMGPYVVRRLAGMGHEVTVFHRGNTTPDFPESVSFIHGDRNELEKHLDAFRKAKPNVVLDMMLINQKQAVDLVKVFSGLARRLVMASSCDVYKQYDLLRGAENGPVKNERITEDSPLRTKIYPYRDEVPDKSHLLYDYDKILVEQAVMGSPLPATSLRLPMVYGPNDYQHRFYEYIKRMADKRPVILLDERQAASRITRGYVENCAEAIARVVCHDRTSGRMYNVGDPDCPTERQWVLMLADAMDWPGKLVTLPADKLPEHLRDDTHWEHHLVVDSSQLREELKLIEIVPRAEALRRTIEWELANPPEKHTATKDNYAAEDAACG